MKRFILGLLIFALGYGVSETWHRFLRPSDTLNVVLQLYKERGQDAVMSLKMDVISQQRGQIARIGAYLEKGYPTRIVGVEDKICTPYNIAASTFETFQNPSVRVGTIRFQH